MAKGNKVIKAGIGYTVGNILMEEYLYFPNTAIHIG